MSWLWHTGLIKIWQFLCSCGCSSLFLHNEHGYMEFSGNLMRHSQNWLLVVGSAIVFRQCISEREVCKTYGLKQKDNGTEQPSVCSDCHVFSSPCLLVYKCVAICIPGTALVIKVCHFFRTNLDAVLVFCRLMHNMLKSKTLKIEEVPKFRALTSIIIAVTWLLFKCLVRFVRYFHPSLLC